MAIRTFAAIDVGSFELELGIYEVSGKYGIKKIDHMRHVIALGKDTYNTGKISYELVDEMCKELEKFTDIMKSYKVEAYRAYATSAMREAANSVIVLDQIRVRTGIEVNIISNSEQRFISYKALASKDAEFNTIIQKGTAIVDVGFGSTQLSLFDKDSLVSTQNLPLGVLRLREMLSRIQADAATDYAILEEIVDNELITFNKMYLKDRNIKNLIGIGDAILYMSKQLINKTAENDLISGTDFGTFYNELIKMNISQVEEKYNVNNAYASLLIPAAIIYKRVLELTGADMFWLPGIRLCDGIAAEYAEQNKFIKFNHKFSEDIIVASRNMAKRYKCNNLHTQAIENSALEIFDAMKRFHGLENHERLLMQIAAIIHACGKFISMRSPGQCAYNIITSTEIIGLSHAERMTVANVVLYNLKDFQYNEATMLTAKLTAILRLANAMDRSHKQKLKDCSMTVKNGELIITTDFPGDITLEKTAFEEKSDFFEEIFGIRPVLKQKRRM